MPTYTRRLVLMAAALAAIAAPALAQSKYPGGKPIEMTTLFGAASASGEGSGIHAFGAIVGIEESTLALGVSNDTINPRGAQRPENGPESWTGLEAPSL